MAPSLALMGLLEASWDQLRGGVSLPEAPTPQPPACSLVGGREKTPDARKAVVAARWSSGMPSRVFQGGLVAKYDRC